MAEESVCSGCTQDWRSQTWATGFPTLEEVLAIVAVDALLITWAFHLFRRGIRRSRRGSPGARPTTSLQGDGETERSLPPPNEHEQKDADQP